jgi:hypothetical protein
MKVTFVTLRGSDARGVGMGPVGAFEADQALLAAVVETPEGNVYVEQHGPAPSVMGSRDGFRQLVEGLRPLG